MSALAIVIIVLALLIGGVGLLVEGLFWLIVIALALMVVGAVTGWTGRGRGARV